MAGMAKRAMGFSEEEYQKGTVTLRGKKEEDLFFEIFLKWKSMVQMEADTKARVMRKIDGLLKKRTEGIMGANRRNYYRECAAFIAALGETRESLGETGAKQRLMASYKEKYTRRSLFRQELRDYGWVDIREKKALQQPNNH